MAARSLSALVSRARSSALLGEFVFFAVSTVALQASRFGVNLYAARTLGPETWGLWYLLNLVLAYSGLIHLGVINAMNRDVPILRGKNDTAGAHRVQSVTLGVMLSTTLVACLALAAAAFAYGGELQLSLLSLALLLGAFQFHLFLQMALKALGHFRKMSQQQLVFALLFPLVALPLTARHGLVGFILAQTVVTAAVALYLLRGWRLELRPVVDATEARRLMRVGTPIMLVGLLYTLLTTVDRWLILAYLDVEQLGYYALAIMVLAVASLLPMVVGQQLYPRMAEAWGRTGSVAEVRRWAWRQAALALAATLPVLAASYLVLPPLALAFLPDYAPGVPAMRIILLGPLFLALSGGFANALNTLGKQAYYLLVQGLALALNVGLNLWLLEAGYGIAGVALGTSLAFAFYGLVLVGVGLRVTRTKAST